MSLEFGMFTDDGESAVVDVVHLAMKYALNDRSVRLMLEALSENETFEEASDTVVRERVFKFLGRNV